jgi:hypothetical protein
VPMLQRGYPDLEVAPDLAQELFLQLHHLMPHGAAALEVLGLRADLPEGRPLRVTISLSDLGPFAGDQLPAQAVTAALSLALLHIKQQQGELSELIRTQQGHRPQDEEEARTYMRIRQGLARSIELEGRFVEVLMQSRVLEDSLRAP